jgi:hypothetical protein
MSNYSKYVQHQLSKINKNELIRKYDDKKIAMFISMLYNNLSNCFSPINTNAFVNHIGNDMWDYFWNYMIKNPNKFYADAAFLIKQLFYDSLQNNKRINVSGLDKFITSRTEDEGAISFIIPKSKHDAIKIYYKNILIDELFIGENGFQLKQIEKKIIPDFREMTLMVSESTIPTQYRTRMIEKSTRYVPISHSDSDDSDDLDDDRQHHTYMISSTTRPGAHMTFMRSSTSRPDRFMTNMSSRATSDRFMTNMSSGATRPGWESFF